MNRSSQDTNFIKYVFTLLTGTAASQALLICFSPILTRFYSPEAFGNFSVMIAVVSILSTVITLRYEMAIPLPQDDEDAQYLVYIALISGCLLSALACLILFAFNIGLGGNILRQGYTWYLILFGILCCKAINQSLNYWMTRKKRFQVISLSKLSNSTTTISYQLFSEIIQKLGAINLILGYLIGNIFETVTLINLAIKHKNTSILGLPHSKEINRARKLFFKYIDMPKYMVQTGFLNSISSNFLPIALSYSTDFFWAGIAMLAQRVVLTPINFVITSIWQVTHSRLGELNQKAKISLFSKVHKSVSYFFALPLAMCAVFGNLSDDIFGQNWAGVGEILPAISIMVYMNSVSNATSYFVAFGYFREEAIANIYLTTIRLGSILIASLYLEPVQVISTYAYSSAFAYMTINLFWGVKLNCVNEFFYQNILKSIVASFSIAFLTKYLFLDGINAIGSLISLFLIFIYYLVFTRKIISTIPIFK